MQKAAWGNNHHHGSRRSDVVKMVPRGLEPRTLRLLAVRSNQLSYETVNGGRCSYVPAKRPSARKKIFCEQLLLRHWDARNFHQAQGRPKEDRSFIPLAQHRNPQAQHRNRTLYLRYIEDDGQ